jgi:hypothetical protein
MNAYEDLEEFVVFRSLIRIVVHQWEHRWIKCVLFNLFIVYNKKTNKQTICNSAQCLNEEAILADNVNEQPQANVSVLRR